MLDILPLDHFLALELLLAQLIFSLHKPQLVTLFQSVHLAPTLNLLGFELDVALGSHLPQEFEAFGHLVFQLRHSRCLLHQSLIQLLQDVRCLVKRR